MDVLTPREREVVRLLAQGMNQREIARTLGVEYCTIRTHIEHIHGKTGTRSAMQLAVKAAVALRGE